jgi:hypothetical protein
MISAPALLLLLRAGAGAAVVLDESRGRLLAPGCGVEVRAGTGPVGREDEALREADSDISDLNLAMLAARDMMAVFVWGVGVCVRMGLKVQRVQQRVLDGDRGRAVAVFQAQAGVRLTVRSTKAIDSSSVT